MLLPTFTFIAYEKCEELSHLFPIFSSKSMEYMIWIAKAWNIWFEYTTAVYTYVYCIHVVFKDIHIHVCKHRATIWSVFLVKDIKHPSEKTKHEAFAMHPENCCDSGHGMRPRLRWPILRQGREIPLGIWSFRSEHEWTVGQHRKQKWYNPRNMWGKSYMICQKVERN